MSSSHICPPALLYAGPKLLPMVKPMASTMIATQRVCVRTFWRSASTVRSDAASSAVRSERVCSVSTMPRPRSRMWVMNTSTTLSTAPSSKSSAKLL